MLKTASKQVPRSLHLAQMWTIFLCGMFLICTACSRFAPREQDSRSYDNSTNAQRLSSYREGESVRNTPPPPVQYAQTGGFRDALTIAQRNKQQAAKLLRNGNLSIKSNDARASLDSIKRVLTGLKGVISYENESRSGTTTLSISATVQIPSEHLETAMTRFAGFATSVMMRTIITEDVGEQIVDVESRVRTKHEVEQHYRELLKQAKSVQDVLAVELQLNTLREEIEAQQSRLAYLNNRVAESTIQIAIYSEITSNSTQENFGKRVNTAFAESWELLQQAILTGIRLFPALCLIVIICAALWLLWKKLRSRVQAWRVKKMHSASE